MDAERVIERGPAQAVRGPEGFYKLRLHSLPVPGSYLHPVALEAIARVAAEAAGLRVAGDGEVVFTAAALRQELERAMDKGAGILGHGLTRAFRHEVKSWLDAEGQRLTAAQEASHAGEGELR